MRRLFFVILLFSLMITACTPATPTEHPSIIVERPAGTPVRKTPVPAKPSATPLPATATPEKLPASPAEQAVVKQLAANLGLQENDISVLRSEEMEFRDSCLGMALEDMMCSQVITPGNKIVLEANGVQYEYHTSRDGGRVQPATLALVWKREGGIAGFCDTLTVFRSGEVFASQCKPQAEGKFGTFAKLLSSQEQKQFNKWIADFAETKLESSDPKGVADRMVVTMQLLGNGTEPLTQEEQQALFEFAQNLYQKLNQ